jgi:hypothetical protein
MRRPYASFALLAHQVALERCLSVPEAELSNNGADNAIRPLELGSKNWPAIGRPSGWTPVGQPLHLGRELPPGRNRSGGIFDRSHRPRAGPSGKLHCGVVAIALETGIRTGNFHQFRSRIFVRPTPLSRSCN